MFYFPKARGTALVTDLSFQVDYRGLLNKEISPSSGQHGAGQTMKAGIKRGTLEMREKSLGSGGAKGWREEGGGG